MTAITETSPALIAYITGVQAKMDAYWVRMNMKGFNVPKIEMEVNKKFIRIVKREYDNDGKVITASVHSFINSENGDILKGSWKAPVKNGKRGNINNPGHDLDKVTHHGPEYLR